MSSLVSSRPLWNWTPLRRLNLTRLLSVLSSQLSARRGLGVNFSSYVMSWSWTCPTVLLLFGDHTNGSSDVMSPTMPTRNVPPVLTCCGFAVATTVAPAPTVGFAGGAVGAGALGVIGPLQAASSAAEAAENASRRAPRRVSAFSPFISHRLFLALGRRRMYGTIQGAVHVLERLTQWPQAVPE